MSKERENPNGFIIAKLPSIHHRDKCHLAWDRVGRLRGSVFND
jgi:hypothetical protein